MGSFAVAMPIPPGAADKYRAFSEEAFGRRRDELAESRGKLGVTLERAWIQHTPGGDVFILLLEGDDPVEANRRFAASEDPFDVWFKQEAGAALGADFSRPVPVRPEMIYESVPKDGPRASQYVCVAIPLVPGKTEAHRQVAEEVKGPRREAFDAFHDRAGVTEDWWIEETPDGDLVLVYLESEDLAGAMEHLARSDEDAEAWFKERLMETQGIDWGGPPPPLPELVSDWTA